MVLVIRGDLLKRYPNTFIYAQKAAWGTGDAREPAGPERRDRRAVRDASQGPAAAVSALSSARIAPDIHFIGFDLTLDEVRGDPRLDETAAARALVGD